MRLAWFTPLPPTRSGIAAYSAEILPHVSRFADLDVFIDEGLDQLVPAASGAVRALPAHELVVRHAREPYDLVIYQLGNSACHDYMWPYLIRYPGLAVLHDAQLHHSRARALLARGRRSDYRAEFAFNHPDVDPRVAEYVVAGLPGSPYYLWPMLRTVVSSSRAVAVHGAVLSRDLAELFPDTPIHAIRMGVRRHDAPATPPPPANGIVFAAFGLVTPEKRIPELLSAFARVSSPSTPHHLLLVGDTTPHYDVAADVGRLGLQGRVTITGYVHDEELDGYYARADVCVSLRWPTSSETSASWLRALAAARPTIISDLVHLGDVPALDPRDWTLKDASGGARRREEAVAVSIDLMDEQHSLELALSRLATDAALRQQLGTNASAWWARDHTLEAMADDYRHAIAAALRSPARPVPRPGRPAHLSDDGTGLARRILAECGVDVDLFRDAAVP